MKKNIFALILIISLIAAINAQGANQITTSPMSISIPFGVPSPITVTYNVATDSGCPQAISNKGKFISGSQVLGVTGAGLTIPLFGGNITTGSGSETVIVPISAIDKAEKMGVNQFVYQRRFNFCDASSTIASVQIRIIPKAQAALRITRLQLYFENRRAEITVKKNQSPKAFADITYIGSGLLEGYWEVDGVRHFNVFKHLTYGKSITLETPDIPALPAFQTGTHRVRFVITNPVPQIGTPEAIYFVTTEELKTILPITLVSPENNSTAEYAPLTFVWERKEKTVAYLIEFLEEGSEKPIFSAFRKDSTYSLPELLFKGIFKPGKTYIWRVKGFDAENNMTGESRSYKLTFKSPSSFLPGRILLVTEDTPEGSALSKGLAEKYKLNLMENYRIVSLGLRMATFSTEGDVIELVEAIGREQGVVLVQPDYIFTTMSEPMSNMQNISNHLNFPKLHEKNKGKGVIVAVIDTGVDVNHKDLAGNVLLSENMIKGDTYIPEIHGTAVAGVIGASINDFGIEGVAPESGILALRACRQRSVEHPEGECYTSAIIKAVDTALQKNARVVNMSLGSATRDELLEKLIHEGTEKGTIFVAPAGNDVSQKGLVFPASHPDVVSVAGLDEKNEPYPNQELASKARVSAPAMNVFTTIPGDKHNFLSGTSMSSAVVSGILTLAKEENDNLEISGIPAFKGSICGWTGELLKVSICEK